VDVRMSHRLAQLDAQTSIADRLGTVLPLAEGAELDDDIAPRARERHDTVIDRHDYGSFSTA
jgi:hypothetical protein